MQQLHCFRCSWAWYPRNPTKTPAVCPRCKSRVWQRPRQAKNLTLPAIEAATLPLDDAAVVSIAAAVMT